MKVDIVPSVIPIDYRCTSRRSDRKGQTGWVLHFLNFTEEEWSNMEFAFHI